MRYAHATPSFWINESNAKLIAAPPKPLPANMKPLASPRLVLKYCDGTVEMTWLVFEVSCKMLCVECITQSMHVTMVEVESSYRKTKTTVLSLLTIVSVSSTTSIGEKKGSKFIVIPLCFYSPDTYSHQHPRGEKQRPDILNRETAEDLAPTHASCTYHCRSSDSRFSHNEGVGNC